MRGASLHHSFFHGESGAGNNFAKGFYTEGAYDLQLTYLLA